MALCLFKCFSACGCRDCIISKFAFYPQKPGYRFEEILDTNSSQSKNITDTESRNSAQQINKKISSFIQQQRINAPRFTSLPSDDKKSYILILVYEESEVLVNDESSLNMYSHQKQLKSELKIEGNHNLTLVNQEKQIIDGKQYQVEIKGVFDDSEQRTKTSSSAAAVRAANVPPTQPQQLENKSEKQKSEIKKKAEEDKKKQQKLKDAKKKGGQKEERFQQVEDLNLVCFKKSNRQNTLLCGYHIENLKHKSEILVIYSHGNSTDIGYMINQALDVSYNLRVNVIAYDYSGYGKSQGQPSEKSFIYDLEAMYNYARQIGYKPINIIFYGQSIGSGPSTFLASQKNYPVGGLVIHSGFTSGLRITQQQQKTMDKTHGKDFFPNIEFIKKVNAPILIVHGTNDQDIKIHHANDLYQKAKQNYKPFLLTIEGAGHNNIEHDDEYRKVYFKKLREFFGQLRDNRRKLSQEFRDRLLFQQQGFGGNRDEKKESITARESQQQYVSGFPGDGQSDSFNHIYYDYFTPENNSIIEKQEKRISIDKTIPKTNTKKNEKQGTSYVPPALNSQQANTLNNNQVNITQNQQQNSFTNQNEQLSIKSRNNTNNNVFNEQNSIKSQDKSTISRFSKVIPNASSDNNEQRRNSRPSQNERESGNTFEEETKIDRTGQQPLSNREDNFTVGDQSESGEAQAGNNYYMPQHGSEKFEGDVARESDDEEDYGHGEQQYENENEMEQDQISKIKYEGNQSIRQMTDDISNNLSHELGENGDQKAEGGTILQTSEQNSSCFIENKKKMISPMRSFRQDPITPTHDLQSKIRMSVPVMFDYNASAVRGNTSSFGSKKYVEDENIRLHNVTSIIRKKQNSQFSAYILDNSNISNDNNVSESLNSSLMKNINEKYMSKHSHSFLKDNSSQSSMQQQGTLPSGERTQKNQNSNNQNKQAAQNYSQSQMRKQAQSLEDHDALSRNYTIKYDQYQSSNNQNQQTQKFNSYQVDSIVREEVTESQCHSSSLKESLIPPQARSSQSIGKIHSAAHSQQKNVIDLNQIGVGGVTRAASKNEILNKITQNQQEDENEMSQISQFANTDQQFGKSKNSKKFDDNDDDYFSQSSSSPHHSSIIKPVNIILHTGSVVAVADSDNNSSNTKKQNGSIKSKDTLRSINSNY